MSLIYYLFSLIIVQNILPDHQVLVDIILHQVLNIIHLVVVVVKNLQITIKILQTKKKRKVAAIAEVALIRVPDIDTEVILNLIEGKKKAAVLKKNLLIMLIWYPVTMMLQKM